jgi:hypothetical protein
MELTFPITKPSKEYILLILVSLELTFLIQGLLLYWIPNDKGLFNVSLTFLFKTYKPLQGNRLHVLIYNTICSFPVITSLPPASENNIKNTHKNSRSVKITACYFYYCIYINSMEGDNYFSLIGLP